MRILFRPLRNTSGEVFYFIIDLKGENHGKQVIVNEICWEYDYSKAKAEEIVSMYEKQGKYEDLCELVKAKQDISMVIREDV